MSQPKNKVEIKVTFDSKNSVLKIMEVISPPEGEKERLDEISQHVIPSSVIQSMFDHGFRVTVAGRPDVMYSKQGNYTSEYEFYIGKGE